MGLALLFASTKLHASPYYWDAGTANILTPGDGLSAGGAGNWSTSLANWDDGSGHFAWPTSGFDNDAIFAGSGGSITLTSAVTVNDLIFNSTGYSIAGTSSNKITLNGTSPTFQVDTNVTATISAAIIGSAGLNKTGNGLLSFTNTLPNLPIALNNTYTGGTFISAGTLAVVTDVNFGAVPGSPSANIYISGGTLQINTGFNLNLNRQIVLGVNNARILLNSTLDFKAQSVISDDMNGAGSLTIQGNGLAGSYIPTAANTYTGDTYLGPGVTTIPGISSTGPAGSPLSGPYGRGIMYWNGGKLRGTSSAFTIGNTIVVTDDTTFAAGGTNTLTISGPVTLQGDRTFTAQNTGNIILSGAIGDGGGASSFTLGALSASNSTVVLTGNNTYTGSTIIEGGTLRLGGTDGSISSTDRIAITSGTLLHGDALAANNAGKTNRINGNLPLELGGGSGGTFTIFGGGVDVAAHKQNFAGLKIERGTNALNSSGTSASSEANVVITGAAGNYQRAAGSILNYTSAVGFNPSFASLPAGTGVSGGVLVGAVRNGTDFIDALSMVFAAPIYTSDVWSANTQTTITTSNAVPFTGMTGSLRFNGAGSVVLTLSESANAIQSGNILVTANVGASNASSISGGTLTSGNGADLIVVQNNGAAIANNTTAFPAALTISSKLTNNGSNPIGFTKAGTGVVILGGSEPNTFTGTTIVLGSGSTTNFAPLILAKAAGANAIAGNLSIGSTGYAAVYLGASQQIADTAVIDFQGSQGSNAFFQLLSFDETVAGLNDPMGVGVVELEEQQVIHTNSTLTLSGSGNYAFFGKLRNRADNGTGTGLLNLALNGTGTQTFSGPSITYTGSTTIQNGTLNLVDTVNFASAVALGNGNATLQISGNTTVTGLLTSGGILNANANVQNAAGVSSILTVNQTTDTSFGGVLRDNPNQTVPSTLALTKTGSGVLALTNANTFTGPVTLNGGVLAVGNNAALGTGMINFNNASSAIRSADANSRIIGNAMTLSTSATFGSSTTGNLLLTGTLDLGGTNKSISVLNQQTEFSGIISSTGAGSLIKLGPGTLKISGANTYTGPTIASEGTLILSGNRTTNSGAITVGNSSANATLELNNGNFLVGGDFVVGLANATGTATVNQTGATITLSNATNQLVLGKSTGASNGDYNLLAGMIIGQASASSGITLGFNNDNKGTFRLSGTGMVSMPTAMLQIGRSEGPADGTQGLFDQTGGFAIFGKMSIGGAAGASNHNTIGILTISGGSFYAGEFISLAGGDTSSATITLGGNATVTLPAFPTTRGVGSTANITFDGATLTPVAASSNYMSGLDHAYLTANGAKLDVPTGKDITIAQVLINAPAEAGRLNKLGAGALTLTGNNTYSGPTTISGGRLVVDGSLTSSVEVQLNGTLSGTGTITGNVTGAGTISPGNSIGTLSIVGNYLPTGTQAFEISKDPQSLLTNDQILVLGNGNLNYDGILQILITPAELATLTVGDSWNLYESSGLISGTFDNDALFGTAGNGSELPMLSGDKVWQFDYQTGVLSVQVVPEPGVWILGVAFGLFGVRKLRSKNQSVDAATCCR